MIYAVKTPKFKLGYSGYSDFWYCIWVYSNSSQTQVLKSRWSPDPGKSKPIRASKKNDQYQFPTANYEVTLL